MGIIIIGIIISTIIWGLLLKNSAGAELVRALMNYPKLWVRYLALVLGILLICSPIIICVLIAATGFQVTGGMMFAGMIIVGVACIVIGLKL